MTKAILVLEKYPESCDECYLCRVRPKGRYCVLVKEYYKQIGSVPDKCPLRPIPDKDSIAYISKNEVIFIDPPKE